MTVNSFQASQNNKNKVLLSVGSLAEDIIREELCIDEGDVIDVNDANPIIRLFGTLANSADLIEVQTNIIKYNQGSAGLFRFLGALLTAGEEILRASRDQVGEAFGYLYKKLSAEAKEAATNNRKNKGLRNIGVPVIPVASQKFITRVFTDPEFLYKTLVDFYFPNLSPSMKRQYVAVIYWGHIKKQPNFVEWLAGEHSVIEEGNKIELRRGLIGAYKFIKKTEPRTIKPENQFLNDALIEKAFQNATEEFITQAPDWLNKCVQDTDEPFMLLGAFAGDEIRFVNYVSTNKSHITAAINTGRGSLFTSDLDFSEGDKNQKIINAVANLITYSGAPELVIWEDVNSYIYVMPLFDEWIKDDSPKVRETDRNNHFAAILRLYFNFDDNISAVEIDYAPDSYEEDQYQNIDPPEKIRTPGYEGLEGYTPSASGNGAIDIEEGRYYSKDPEGSIMKVGYVTSEVLKLKDFKGDVKESLKFNEDKSAITFMGVQWLPASTRRQKRQDAKDIEKKRTRLPTIPGYGFEYILACSYNELTPDDPSYEYGRVMSENIDFRYARDVFKIWTETRTQQGVSKPEYITICVKDGEIGIWFEDVVVNGITYYENHGELIRVGTTEPWLFGQWRVPVYQLQRVWNVMTGPWEFYLPWHIDAVKYHPERNMNLHQLKYQMASERKDGENLSFGHLPNLCSTREIDDGLYTYVYGDDINDENAPTETKRKCVPLVLRCGAMWLYLFNETK